MTKKISRLEFLKILGASGVGLALGSFAFTFFRENRLENRASAQSYGSWQLGGQTHATPIHSAMLYNGKILYVAGSGFYGPNELGPFEQGIYDPVTDTNQPLPNIDEDMFCVAHNQLPDGNILLTGGTLTYNSRSANGKWHGLNGAWIYDVPSNTLRRITSMSHGRWYPTNVTLADGKVLVVGGWDEYGVYNRLAELFDPATETWSIVYDPNSTETYCVGEGEDPLVVPGAGQPCYGPGIAPGVLLYPRMHLMPSGLVAVCGQSKTMRTFDPATGIWDFAGNMLFGESRGYGSSCLLPLQNTAAETGSILIFGGTADEDFFATNTAEILTPSGTALQPRWTNPSQFGRKHPIPVIMPDGKVLVIGGTAFQNSLANKIMEAELFDPITEAWTTLPAMTIPRMYHSSALLLADGRVWVAGTTYSLTSRELQVEYFVPSYYSATRPTISGAPAMGPYGGTITIPTPDGLDIDSVSLVAMSTQTHAYNTDQRLIWLQIQTKTATEVVVSAPINANIAPPGYYYIFILKQGVPSVAQAIKIPGLTPPPDTTIPTISIVTPAVDEVLTGPAPSFEVTVTGTAADVGTGLQVVEVSIDAGPFTAATGTDSWSFATGQLTEGLHTINARARDVAGNISDVAMRSFTIQITTGGTFVEIYSVAGSNSYGTIFSGGSTGAGEKIPPASSLVGSAIKRVSVILKKSGNTTGDIFVRIRDSTGAIAKEIGTIDASALTAADQTFELTASSTYLLQADDVMLVEWAGTGSGADVVSVKRSGTDSFDGANTHFVTRNASGSYSNHSNRDLAGVWSYESATQADTTFPTIGVVTPTQDQVLTGDAPGFTVGVTGTAADAGGGLQVIEVSVDSGPYAAATGTDSWSFTTPVLTAGPHTIAARAKDNAGNTTDAPVVNITIEVITGGTFVEIYSVAGSNSYGTMSSTGASGDTTGIGEKLTSSSSLVGAAIKRASVTLKKSGTPTGTLFVRIRDSTGAIAKEIGTIDASALTAVDQAFVVTASSAHILQADDVVLVEWAGTGSLADVVSVKRTGTDSFDGTSTYFVARKASGSYSNSTSRDMAGIWSYENSTPLDTVLPTISVTSPVADEVFTGAAPGYPVTVTGTASDAESGLQMVEVSVDAGPFTAATGTDSWSFATSVLTAGPHTIAARAKDNAGNIAEAPVVNITIEVTTSGNFTPIYSVAGTSSYGTMYSTGSNDDFTGQGEKMSSASSLAGSAIKRVAVVLKKAGNPTGTINIRVRNGSDDSIALEIGTIDAATLTTMDQIFEVTASSAHILQADDKVMVEWSGTGSSTDIVYVKRHGVDGFDGSNTHFVSRKASGSYTNGTTRDLAGDWYYET